MSRSHNLYKLAKDCLLETSPAKKVSLTRQTVESWAQGELQRSEFPIDEIPVPGRPAKPELVAPRDLPRRSLQTPQGHAALIHSICHIEFNAINLAWDAVYRFHSLPDAFYTDWMKVASEEAYHFDLLSRHLETLGYQYGDFPAHNGLWEAAVKTAHDPLVRMALVPRVLEARGLDVTPGIVDKLRSANDLRAVEILDIIHRDEVGHVEIGSRWFKYLCEQRGLAVESTFQQLLEEYMQGQIKGPLNRASRLKA
ncbi:MAG: ferritin-like domain-containing protein, partial [Thioalkalispiraceae bacterium]